MFSALADKDFRWFFYSDYGLDLYSNGIVVSQKLIKEKPEAVRGMVRAINRAILLQHNSYMEERIKRHLVNIADADAFIHAMLAIYQMYDESRSRDPMFGSLWSIVQGDTSLQTIETQATLKNASHLLAEAKKHFPGANDDELMASCVFALQLSATASHLNRTMPKALARQMSQTHEQAITNALNALR